MKKTQHHGFAPDRRAAAFLGALLPLLLLLCAPLFCLPVAAASSQSGDEPEDVNIVYFEDFDYPDTTGNNEVVDVIGWRILSSDTGDACTVPTTQYSLVDGRLYLNNYENVGGKDSYILILDDDQMAPATAGDYTLQYDVTLDAAADSSRYIVVLTDYNASTVGGYNSFHLRIRGSANNQSRINGQWYTYDAPGDYYAADTNDSDATTTVLFKLLGVPYDNSYALAGLDLTIRYVCPLEGLGPTVYIRNNTADGEFVKVSEPAEGGNACPFWHTADMPGRALTLKTGGAIDGSVDNIIVWRGTGEPVFEVITTAAPETLPTPETTAEESTAVSRSWLTGLPETGDIIGTVIILILVADAVLAAVWRAKIQARVSAAGKPAENSASAAGTKASPPTKGKQPAGDTKDVNKEEKKQ